MKIKSGHIKSVKIFLLLGTITLLTFVIYVSTTNLFFTEDSMIYAADTIKGTTNDLFHPHHLLYIPLLKGLLLLNGSTSSLQKLLFFQNVNICISSLCIGLLFLILWKLKKNLLISLYGSLLAAVSYGIWRYSSQIEVYNLSALLIVVFILFLLQTDLTNAKMWKLIFGAFLIALILFAHQINIFFVLSILFTTFSFNNLNLRYKIKIVVIFVVVPILLVACTYFVLTAMLYGTVSIFDTWKFITCYAQTGWWGSFHIKNFLKWVYGFVQAVVSLNRFSQEYKITDIFEISVFLIVVLYFILITLKSFKLSLVNDFIARMLYIWIVLHSIFIWWWYPSNPEFWITIIPSVVILFISNLKTNIASPSKKKVIAVLGLLLITIILHFNLSEMLLLKKINNEYLCSSEGMSTITNDKDLVVSSGFGKQHSYLRYFLKSSIYPLHQISLKSCLKTLDKDMIKLLDSLFLATVSNGYQVIITEDVYKIDFPIYRSLKFFDKESLQLLLSKYQWEEITICNTRFYKAL